MSRFTSERFCSLVESGDVHKICDEFDALLTSHADLLDALQDALKTAAFERHPFRPWHNKAATAIAHTTRPQS